MEQDKITKEDIANVVSDIKTANEIAELMDSNNSECSLEEYPNLLATVNHNKYSYELLSRIANGDLLKVNNDRKEKDIRRLLSTIANQAKAQKRRKRIVALTFLATAASLVISFLIWNGADEQKSESPLFVVEHSAPTLLLSDGRVIDLNDQQKIVENNNILTIETDKLSYAAGDTLSTESLTNKLIIPKMKTYNVVLSDGTEVILNAKSTLTYPFYFSDSIREVVLEGEAYFKVTKGGKPFVVRGRDMSVRVYGTEFNVSMRGRCETVLVEGSVGVTTKNGDEVIMVPNQLFAYDPASGKTNLETVNTICYRGWLENQFVADKSSLSTLIRQIENWYGVKFNYKHDRFRSTNVTVLLSRELGIDELLSILGDITNLKFTAEGGDVYLIE